MPKKSTSKKPAPKKSATKKKASAQIKEGFFVKVEYTGTFEDGTVFDSSDENGAPLEFQIGAGQVIEGFEKAIAKMKVGQEKEISLKPEEAYGEYHPDMKRELPRDRLPMEDLKAGMTLMATMPTGMQIPVTVTEVTKNTVTIDLNHPLAGKVLNFRIKLVGVKEGELCECDDNSCHNCSCH